MLLGCTALVCPRENFALRAFLLSLENHQACGDKYVAVFAVRSWQIVKKVDLLSPELNRENSIVLCPQQYRFRKEQSTVDVVREVHRVVARAVSYNHFSHRVMLLVTLDVKNAFSSTTSLGEDYLHFRNLIFQTRDRTPGLNAISGAASRLILGPDL